MPASFSPSFLRLVRGVDGNLFRHMNAISLQHSVSAHSQNYENEIGEPRKTRQQRLVSCEGAQPVRRGNYSADILVIEDVSKPVLLKSVQRVSACLKSPAASEFLVELFSQYGKLEPPNKDPDSGPDYPGL